MSFKGPVSLKTRLALEFAEVPIVGQIPIGRYLRARYGDRVVTPAKVANFVRTKRDLLRRSVSVESLPTILNLDTFNACNLKCPFCATGTGQMDRAKARMSIDRAKSIIDKVRDHVLEVRFYNWGEPFLNPDIFEIVRYAHDAGLFTIVHSNLSVRVDHLAEQVVASKLDLLQGSVDGLTQETLPIYRRRAEAGLVFDNVRRIAAERARQGATHPRIELAFLVFRHNEHELPQLEVKRRHVPDHPGFRPMQELFEGTCDYLYSELTIEASGAVSPCCANTSERWDVGHIDEVDDVRTLWNGPRYRAMRAFNAGVVEDPDLAGAEPTLCHSCDFVKHSGTRRRFLSPAPPAFQAQGLAYRSTPQSADVHAATFYSSPEQLALGQDMKGQCAL